LTRRKTAPAHGQRAETAAHARRPARLPSLVRVQAVTHPAGVPARAPDVVYLRIHATRMTTTSVGRQVARDGAAVQLTRSGSRRPARAALCC
jgi:hypothetical protein